jgi:DNA-directed RNA polymerase subunit RPC12/RpoP
MKTRHLIKVRDTTHEWYREEGEAFEKGEPGYYIKCDKCGHRIFILAKWSDFQRELDITFYFEQVLSSFKLKQEIIDSFTLPASPETHNFDVGVHGRMARDCDMAIEFPRLASVFEVMGV